MEGLTFNHIRLLLFFVSGCVADDHSPDISSAAYFGCYSDIGDHATFIKPLQNMTNLTPDACRRRCNNEDSSFVGLWGGTNCWCADTNPDNTMNLRKLDNSKCNRTCSGNSSISCGGLSDVLRNYIYSVYSVCPKTWFGPRCTERCNCKNRIHCSIHGVCPDNQCASGWKLEIKLNRPRCQADVDECSANISICGDICTNSVGSYECSCRTGYELRSDKHTCSDIDECSDESSCAHLCNNTVGSFICSCFSGFTRNESDQRRCIDINECSINNGDCNETCSNTDGGYYCSCPFGYKLQDDKQSCQEGPLLLILSFIKRHYIYILSAIAGLILILVIGLCIKNKRSAKEKCSVGNKFDLIASTGREDETTTETAEVVLYSSVNGIKETGHRNEYTSGNDDSTSEEMGGSYVSMDGVEESYYANGRPDDAPTAGVNEVLYSSINRVGGTDDDNVIYQDVR